MTLTKIKESFILAENIAAIAFVQFIVLHELCHYVMVKLLHGEVTEVVWFRFATMEDIRHGYVSCNIDDTNINRLLLCFAPMIYGLILMLIYEIGFNVFNLRFIGGLFLVAFLLILPSYGDMKIAFEVISRMMKKPNVVNL